MSSQITHTHNHQHSPRSPYTPTPLQVITTRAWEGSPKEHWAKQNCCMKLIQLHMHLVLHSFLSFTYCHAASTFTPLLPKATFTPSIQPNLGLPHAHLQRTSAINTLQAIPYSPFFTHATRIISDLLYSITPFLFQLSYAPLYS